MDHFFSDSDEDKAVEDLLSQAMDSTILEQVAKINCASFSNSDLPSHLESRFQKLKSFPSSATKPSSLSSSKSFNRPKFYSVNEAKSSDEKNGEKGFSPCLKKSPEPKLCLSPSISSESGDFSPLKKNPKAKLGENEAKSCVGKNREKGFTHHSKKSPESKSSGSGNFSPLKKNPQKKLGKNEIKSPFSSSSSWEGFNSSRSISPPAKSGCFLCSPKKVSRKKSKENKGFDLGLDWGKNDELLSDLSNSQKKMIKKAMEEEEKICREADKIVKWAKHASARMEVSDIDDELSDDDKY